MKIILSLAVLIGGVIGYAAPQPTEFRIIRSTVINAPDDFLFEHVNDLRKFNLWNPWIKLDPTAKQSYGRESAGVGADFSWEGNKEVGAGQMKIIETQPPKFIKLQLNFFSPMTATNFAEFNFAADGMQTRVSWAMNGQRNLLQKVVGIFINVDKMVGGMFEQGLEQLKRLAEGA